MSVRAISKLTFRHHVIIGLIGCLWLTAFLVFVGPYDTAPLSLEWRARVMLVYGLVFLVVYVASVPLQNLIYKRLNQPPLLKELLIYLYIFCLSLIGCYLYYISETINGTYSFYGFTVRIFLPTIAVFFPLIAACRWAAANWRLPKWLAVPQNQAEIEALKPRIQALIDEKIFLEKDISLSAMAKRLGTNSAALSKAINVGYGHNFNDFINGYRIEAVITALKNGAHKTHTLQGIAMNCGFNSKATFNRAFKKHLQVSPSEYLQEFLSK